MLGRSVVVRTMDKEQGTTEGGVVTGARSIRAGRKLVRVGAPSGSAHNAHREREQAAVRRPSSRREGTPAIETHRHTHTRGAGAARHGHARAQQGPRPHWEIRRDDQRRGAPSHSGRAALARRLADRPEDVDVVTANCHLRLECSLPLEARPGQSRQNHHSLTLSITLASRGKERLRLQLKTQQRRGRAGTGTARTHALKGERNTLRRSGDTATLAQCPAQPRALAARCTGAAETNSLTSTRVASPSPWCARLISRRGDALPRPLYGGAR